MGLAVAVNANALALEFDYKLGERLLQLAPNVYVVQGDHSHFSAANGGNIVNTGFVVTDDGVLVIDTGPSLQYGKQFRALIESVTDSPIKRVVNSHHHPDHFFGNQAFSDVPIAATAETRLAMAARADAYADSLYRLIGRAMFGTEYLLPTETVSPGPWQLGDRQVEFIESAGHTESELVISDSHSGVLFVGDLVFHQRAPTTPHADIEIWLASLTALRALDFSILVPGHGPVDRDGASIKATSTYLQWLQESLRAAASRGATAAEALHQPLPAPFDDLAAMPDEYQRSVHHLYPKLEEQSFYEPLSLERN